MTSRRWAMGGEEAVGVRLLVVRVRVRVRSLGEWLAGGLSRAGETSSKTQTKNTARDLSGGRPAYGGRSNSSSECCCCSGDSEGLSQRPRSASTWFFPRRRGAAGGVDVTGMGMGGESSRQRHRGRRAGGGEAECGRRELRAWAWGKVKVFRTVVGTAPACCQCRGTRAP